MASAIQRRINKATGISRRSSGAATKNNVTLKMVTEESQTADKVVDYGKFTTL